MISPPVAVEPVKATLSTPGWRHEVRAGGRAVARDDVDAPGGKPTSVASSAIRSADSGVAGSGLSTTAQPAASAGASFHVAIISG